MEKTIANQKDYRYIPITSSLDGEGIELLPDLYCYTTQISNLVFLGKPSDTSYTIIDAGMPESGEKIIAAAEKRFGKKSKPNAILLTHGHFDHVGGIIDMLNYWDIPVYAHPLEIPFLTGEKSYPKADISVEGGAIAKMSFIFPHEPIQLGNFIKELPKDGSVPFLPDFNYIHTPGHSPGHVSFFREKDRTIIAGDAFITVKQDELYQVLTQQFEIQGPPRYFTTDWQAAHRSVEAISKLNPSCAITGHGKPIKDETLPSLLKQLDEQFEEIAIPDKGKYAP